MSRANGVWRFYAGMAAIVLLVALGAGFIGSWQAQRASAASIEEAESRAKEASETAQMLEADLEGVRSEVASLTGAVTGLAKDNAGLKSKIESQEKVIKDLKRQNESLSHKARAIKYSKAPKPLIPAKGEHGGVWSAAKTARVLSAKCDKYHVTGSEKDFLVSKGVHIIYYGAENRGGQTWLKNKNSSAMGLLQYLRAWNKQDYGCVHGSSDWRACGTCSLDRFVRYYKERGVSGLKSTWAATYY